MEGGDTMSDENNSDGPRPISAIDGAVSTAGAAAGAYHGYKRNGSLGWAIAWGLCGSISPVITTAVAFAQGFAEPAKKNNPSEPARAIAKPPAREREARERGESIVDSWWAR